MREIGARLGVASVLEGSVRRAGDRLRVTVQLIEVAHGFHLWSERYDRRLDDVFEIQDQIAARIADALANRFGISSTISAAAKRMPSLEAYDLYLRGMHYYWMVDPKATAKSIACFERAAALDPWFAGAYAGLSMVLSYSQVYGFQTINDVLEMADAAAARALELDNSLGEAHTALGAVRAWLRWDWTGAERAFQRALELNPGYVLAHSSYAFLLAQLGRTSEAVAEILRAHELDPLSVQMHRMRGEIMAFDRQYDEAIRHLGNAVAMAPQLSLARQGLAMAYAANGMPAEAMRQRQEIFRCAGKEKEARELEIAFSEGGEAGMLRWYVDRSLRAAERAETDPRSRSRAEDLALLYARLGESEAALRWLDEAIRGRGNVVLFAKVHPWFDSVRSDPRFGAALRKMGFE